VSSSPRARTNGVLRARVRAEAALFLRRQLAAVAITCGAGLLAVAVMALDASRRGHPLTVPAVEAWLVEVELVVLAVVFVCLAGMKRELYRCPIRDPWWGLTPEERRAAALDVIAAKARELPGPRPVALDGRVSPAPDGMPLEAPLSRARCVYYRVVVEQWTADSFPRSDWSTLDDQWQREAFVLSAESGPMTVERWANDANRRDCVEAFSSISSVAHIHDSPSGVDGLPPHVRAYVEATERPYQLVDRTQPLFFDRRKRTRVTELTLAEGDLIFVTGFAEQRGGEADMFPDAMTDRCLIIPARLLLRIFPAPLADLLWVRSFHRWFTRALIAGGMLCAGMSILGFYLMVRR
jgi:hypothetical protein